MHSYRDRAFGDESVHSYRDRAFGDESVCTAIEREPLEIRVCAQL